MFGFLQELCAALPDIQRAGKQLMLMSGLYLWMGNMSGHLLDISSTHDLSWTQNGGIIGAILVIENPFGFQCQICFCACTISVL